MSQTVIDELIKTVEGDKATLINSMHSDPIADMGAFNLLKGQIIYAKAVLEVLESLKTRYEEGDLDE